MTDIRERISHGVTRPRVELELRRSVRPLAVYAGGLLLALGIAIYIASHLPGAGVGATFTARFAVGDATGVVAGRDEVRVRGIVAGTITEADLRGGRAILTAKIQRKYGPIYRDARAQLRPNTPIQDIYLDVVDRGTPGAGEAAAGTPLPEDRTSASINIADVLQAFDADVRGNLRTTLSQFGGGLEDRGARLRAAFVQAAPLVTVAAKLAEQVATRSTRTRRLISNAATLTGELGRRQQELRTLVTEGASALGTLADGHEDLDRTLRELPPTLAELDSTFTALRSTLPTVDRTVTALEPSVRRLPGALTATRKLVDDAQPAVDALRTPVRRLLPLSRALRPLSHDLAGVVDALRPQAAAFDHITESVGGCGMAIQRFFQWTQSVFALGDAHGGAPRGDASFGIDSTSVIADPGVTRVISCAGGKTIGGVPATIFKP